MLDSNVSKTQTKRKQQQEKWKLWRQEKSNIMCSNSYKTRIISLHSSLISSNFPCGKLKNEKNK